MKRASRSQADQVYEISLFRPRRRSEGLPERSETHDAISFDLLCIFGAKMEDKLAKIEVKFTSNL